MSLSRRGGTNTRATGKDGINTRLAIIAESAQDPVAQWLKRWSLLAICVRGMRFARVWQQPDYPGPSLGRVGGVLSLEGYLWVLAVSVRISTRR